MLLIILCAVLIFCVIIPNVEESKGKVTVGDCDDLLGEDYEAVLAHFEAAGFTDIELIDLDDSGILFWKKGKVAMILIGGKIDFEETDWFWPDTKVIISYH